MKSTEIYPKGAIRAILYAGATILFLMAFIAYCINPDAFNAVIKEIFGIK